MDRLKTPNEYSNLLSELIDEIDFLSQVASSKDQNKSPGYNVNLARVKELIVLSAEIIEILSKKTQGGKEARFVANLVRLAVEHWQSGEMPGEHHK